MSHRSSVTRLAALALMLLALVGCTGEEPTPIDLHQTSSSVASGTPTSLPADGNGDLAENEASRQMAVEFARKQCFDDPDATQGIIRIVEPDTDQVVGEVIVECDEVRSEE